MNELKNEDISVQYQKYKIIILTIESPLFSYFVLVFYFALLINKTLTAYSLHTSLSLVSE